MKKYAPFIVMGVLVFVTQVSFIQEEPADKAALGEILFSDPILSRTRTISCANCHLPAFAFADTLPVSHGVEGRKGVRNTPSAMNLSLQRSFFWDGRAKTLEEQALAPISNPDEMDLPLPEAIQRLNADTRYKAWFRKIFGGPPDSANLAAAIAAFERTLETSNSPFDNWKFSDDPSAVSDAAKRGFELFNGKGKCVKCHFGADFTAQEFRNIGLFNARELNDSGRAIVVGNKEETGKFKTPGLRNVAVTAPYMHNGMFKELGEVINFYNEPDKFVTKAIGRDTILLRPLGLSEEEKKDLLAFLVSLTDKKFEQAALRSFNPRIR
ncbi:cytochrome-c peroxidase [Chitinophaga barathri]|uniref:Cytochrome-c peroxidase n=1 Tax=Chitinophaga barathri TaxID=1647451 RepID=A0A3N4M7M2_9BACT|nr:cytochrome c peroxidase [Chitinophaga barathri]RPD39524.1 cytochrome-c peroxidase [Chitinophaga barathri]